MKICRLVWKIREWRKTRLDGKKRASCVFYGRSRETYLFHACMYKRPDATGLEQASCEAPNQDRRETYSETL